MNQPGERGAALAYVLVLLVISALLIGILIRQIRFNNHLVLRHLAVTEAQLLAQSGEDYAVAVYGDKLSPTHLQLSLNQFTYNFPDAKFHFHLDVNPLGLFGGVRSQGEADYPGWRMDQTFLALAGESFDFRNLPALGLLNRTGGLILSGNSSVTGAVLVWKGDVEKDIYGKVRFTGSSGHQGAVWDSTNALWKELPPVLDNAATWLGVVDTAIQNGSMPSQWKTWWDSAASVYADSTKLQDTTLSNRVLIGKEALVLGDGFICQGCAVLAKKIEVQGDATLNNALFSASGKIYLSGNAQISGGQYLAGDSLIVNLSEPMSDYPLFYSRGTINLNGKDSIYTGALVVTKASGTGLFFAHALGKELTNSRVDMVLDSATRLEGFAYCAGYATLNGNFTGSILSYNLRFDYDGTIYLGHLKDARLSSWTKATSPDLPLIFSRTPVHLFRRRLL